MKSEKMKAYEPSEIKIFKQRVIRNLWKGKTLVKILKRKKMPSRWLVYAWLNPANVKYYDRIFQNDYYTAREEQADKHAENIQQVRDLVKKGLLDPHAARVIIEADKYLARVKKPKVYGDRLDLTTAGNPIEQQILIKLPDNGRKQIEEKKPNPKEIVINPN